MPIGPTLPPHLAHLANTSHDGDRDDRSAKAPAPASSAGGIEEAGGIDEEEDYGPALPPHLAASRAAKPSGPQMPSSTASGPSRSSALYSSPSPPRMTARDTQPRPRSPADDSDDDIGPRPEMAADFRQKSAAEEFREREERRARLKDERDQPVAKQREEWMLVPPSSGVLSSVDPTRKRPTTFSRSNQPVGGPIDHTTWTETPAEKAQRLAEEAAGIKRPPPRASHGGVEVDDRKRRRDEAIKDEVDRHSKQHRGASLLEKHQKKDKGTEEPAAIWDHARDMGITGRLLNDQERQSKINDARGLNDRFGHGKSGAYQI